MSRRPAIHVITDLRVRHAEPDAAFHHRVDALMDELVVIEQNDVELTDGTVSGDSGGRRVTIELLVLTDDPVYAVTRSICAVRAAVEAVLPWDLEDARARTEPATVAA